jgi:zinc/manganese transport system ATP-binding protein
MTAPAPGNSLAVDRLSVSLGGRAILRDVGFTLQAGEFCGLIGANGSGKTTLLRAILGLVAPSAGRVTRDGHAKLAAVGYVPQKSILDPYIPMRARDLVALGLDGNRLGLPLPSQARRQRVDAMLAAVDATPFADQRIGALSGVRGCCCWMSRWPTSIWAASPGSSRCCAASAASTRSRSCSRPTT